jgi:dihydroxyacid dehydratase/phosphogluconate dehydratase
MYVLYVCILIIGVEMSVGWNRYLLDNKMIHGDCLTVTGKTIAENLASVKPVEVGNGIIFPLEAPIKETGHLQILYGNLVPYIHTQLII